MSYTIQYSPEHNKKYPTAPARKKWNRLVVIGVFILAFCIGWLGMNDRTKLKEFLLPGDPVQTEAAFDAMVKDIREGTNVQDAITAFCQEIIENAHPES